MKRRRSGRHCILGTVPLRGASPIPWLSVTTIFLMVFLALGSDLCPDNWTEISGRCYSYIHEPMNWTDAKAACERNNSHLAKIDDLEVNQQMALYSVYRETWLGGSDMLEEGNWTWVDGSPVVDIGQWYPGEPDNGSIGQDCMVVTGKRFKWGDRRCDRFRKFVCEKDDVDSSCGGFEQNVNTSEFNGHCYALYNVMERWETANEKCVNEFGGYLAKVDTSFENTWLGGFGDWNAFNGGNDIKQEGVWVWADGSPMNYMNWKLNKPSNSFFEQNCLSFYDWNDSRWIDENCNHMKYPLCEIEPLTEAVQSTTTRPTNPTADGHTTSDTAPEGRFCYIVKTINGYTMKCD